MISAIVITLNEEANLPACLDSLTWVDEVIVVDAGSQDRTVEIARAAGAICVERMWTGFSDQRNHAISYCRGDWVLYLDADERLSADFAQEARVIEREAPVEVAGFRVDSREFFMGRFLRHGGFGKGQSNWKVRLWRRSSGEFEGVVHERLNLSGRVDTMRTHVQHMSTSATIAGLVEKYNNYSSLEVERRGKPTRGSLYRGMVFRPARVFFSRFVRYQGYRDGVRGLIISTLAAWYEFVVHAKLIEANLNGKDI